MFRTILLLITTLITLPVLAYYQDTAAPLTPEQWDGLWLVVKIMLATAFTCFITSELSGNYSQVDKIWSLIPIVYAWTLAWQSGFDTRIVLMAVLVTIWGARLTYNFARRDAYQWPPWAGEEDYRWAILRQNPLLKGRLRWSMFNLFFISLYQNSLILLFTLPALVAWQGSGTPLNWLDYLAAALMFGAVVLEYVADQQQYDFQTEKHRRIREGLPLDGDYARGFRTTGLWAKMRHPNYTGEQLVWISFYLFSAAATGRWVNWSITGAVLLLLLFWGSSDFSEKISAGKYAEYKDYQRRVGRFLPW